MSARIVNFPRHHLLPVPRLEGIFYCTRCCGAEASLPTHCPGFELGGEQQNLIAMGRIDFKDGAWFVPDFSRFIPKT